MAKGQNIEFLKISKRTSAASIAGAVAGMVKDGKPTKLQCIGAGAVNQAIKGATIARSFLIADGVDIALVPSFVTLSGEGDEECTAIRLQVVKVDHDYVKSKVSSTGDYLPPDHQDTAQSSSEQPSSHPRHHAIHA
jgi:stage V sporulation protein S